MKGVYLHSSVKEVALETIDSFVRGVAVYWMRGAKHRYLQYYLPCRAMPLPVAIGITGTDRQKITSISRFLYGLREGPLLDGPSLVDISPLTYRYCP